jgi:hypothetical protein
MRSEIIEWLYKNKPCKVFGNLIGFPFPAGVIINALKIRKRGVGFYFH